jgi:hypothetical protein
MSHQNQKEKIKKLLEDSIDYLGTEKGDKARKEYEIYKLEIERKRNSYLFFNTIFLALIALINLIYTIIKYYTE